LGQAKKKNGKESTNFLSIHQIKKKNWRRKLILESAVRNGTTRQKRRNEKIIARTMVPSTGTTCCKVLVMKKKTSGSDEHVLHRQQRMQAQSRTGPQGTDLYDIGTARHPIVVDGAHKRIAYWVCSNYWWILVPKFETQRMA